MATEVEHDERDHQRAPLDLVTLVRELRERHLFKIAAAYAVGAWLVIQVVDTVGPAFELPEWVLRAVILAAIFGFLGTMGVLLFRPRHEDSSALPIYLSRRARLVAAAAILVMAITAAVVTVRHFTARQQVTLAVMPFADLSPQRDKAFLAEGVAEEILGRLGQSSELKVLGRTSSWALRERADDLDGLRASFGVTHLLEGSVRAAGPDLRLSVRLIRTKDGSQEWAEDYRGRGEDVFALQDKVAQAVAARLNSAGSVAARTSRAEITTADAYNLYLAARQIARTRTEPELKRAYALARQVIEGQPNFAPGHALFAELTWMLSDGSNSYGSIPVDKAYRIAVPHARKAMALAPNAPDGYSALGLIESVGRGLPALQRAMELDPARSELPLWMALELDTIGRFKDAIVYLERAAAIDPLWPAAVSRLAYDLNVAGHSARAKQVIDDFERRGGDAAQVARMRATTAYNSGDLSLSVHWGMRGLKLNPALPYVPGNLQHGFFLMNAPPPVRLVAPGQPLRARFFAEGFDAVVNQEPLSAELWQKADVEFYVFAAGASRDWPRLTALYDRKADAFEELCVRATHMAGTFVMALRETGRSDEAQKLLGCTARQVATIRYGGPRRIRAIAEAEIAALSGESKQALDLLDNALSYGWNGKTARLTDFPAFNSLAREPRYAALQRKLDGWLARERRETLATLRHSRR